MKNLIIAANFKSNLTQTEEENFIDNFQKNYNEDPAKEIIFCPSFVGIPLFFSRFKEKYDRIAIGAQNVSSFEAGPFTGEVNARQIKDYCKYCIVGHSERRMNFSEDLSTIIDKIKNLLDNQIMPILCISSLDELNGLEEYKNTDMIIAYEPLAAIGSGDASDPDEADRIASQIKSNFNAKILYGGSVDSANVAAFTVKDNIDGVLVGGESLNPQSFLEIIKNA